MNIYIQNYLESRSDIISKHNISRYISFVKSIMSKHRTKGERHHIIPHSLDKLYSNDKANIVVVTPREHWLCHYILGKAFGGNQWYACNIIAIAINPYQNSRQFMSFNSKLYEHQRVKYIETLKINTSNYRQSETKEQKDKRISKWKESVKRCQHCSRVLRKSATKKHQCPRYCKCGAIIHSKTANKCNKCKIEHRKQIKESQSKKICPNCNKCLRKNNKGNMCPNCRESEITRNCQKCDTKLRKDNKSDKCLTCRQKEIKRCSVCKDELKNSRYNKCQDCIASSKSTKRWCIDCGRSLRSINYNKCSICRRREEYNLRCIKLYGEDYNNLTHGEKVSIRYKSLSDEEIAGRRSTTSKRVKEYYKSQSYDRTKRSEEVKRGIRKNSLN